MAFAAVLADVNAVYSCELVHVYFDYIDQAYLSFREVV